MFKHRIATRLLSQDASGLYRRPPCIDKRDGKYVYVDGKKLLNFSSNDYLGLGNDKLLQKKTAKNFTKYGSSSSSSRLVSGNYNTIKRAEQAYADFFQYESALFFPSGYQANFGLISTVFEKGDTILFDKHIHASSVKGMRSSQAQLKGFNHNDMEHLAKRLENHEPGSMAVLTESLFSMDGDLLKVDSLLGLKHTYEFLCIVDEAHSFGAMGKSGRGIANCVADIAIGTFGKALGLFGAFVLLPKDFREYLINFASPLIYSTTLPEAHAATALDLLEIVEACDNRRKRLQQVGLYAKQRFGKEGFTVSGDAYILGVEIGEEDLAATVAGELLKHGIFAFAARYPTVPMGRAILRISVTSLHSKADIDCLIQALKTVLFQCPKQTKVVV